MHETLCRHLRSRIAAVGLAQHSISHVSSSCLATSASSRTCRHCVVAKAHLLCLAQQFIFKNLGSQFDEEPKYTAYVALFEPLCGPGPQRPILLEDKARVGQKRGRDSAEDEMLEIVRLLDPLLGRGSLVTDRGH